jgi:hypothetical protein
MQNYARERFPFRVQQQQQVLFICFTFIFIMGKTIDYMNYITRKFLLNNKKCILNQFSFKNKIIFGL